MGVTRRVLRWMIPADDQWHELTTPGPILHVATRAEAYAEVWALDDPDGHVMTTRWLRVFGTGQLGVEGEYVGTAITPSRKLVWHVFERRQ